MNRKVILTIVIVLVLIAGAAGVGFAAFRAGTAYGISQAPAVATAIAQSGANNGDVRQFGPMMYGYGQPGMAFGPFGMGMRGFGRGGFGFGFGLLQCLVPLFILLAIFAFFRLVFRPWGWRGGWRGGPWGHHGPNGEGVPPMFEEWHKRAHGQPTPPPPAGDNPPSTNA